MAFAALLFSLLCLVLRGTWAAPGDMLSSALHRLRTGEGIQLRLFHTITRQLRYARYEEMLINIWGTSCSSSPTASSCRCCGSGIAIRCNFR